MNFHDFSVKRADGSSLPLSELKGKAVLVVNVATKCGLAPQYEGLQALYDKYEAKGFTVLGFPCNQFGNQEPGNDAEIQNVCSTQFDVNFPILAKIEVDKEPLYEWLKDQAPGILGTKAIKWNFTKFLVNPDGKVLKRYAPLVKPEQIAADIEKTLPTH